MSKAGAVAKSKQPDPAKEREALLQAILETCVDGIITIDESGIIESLNSAAQRIFGYEPVEVVGKNVSILMPSPYREEHDSYLQNYLKTGEAKIIGIGREALGKRKDGAVFPIELAVSEIRLPARQLFTGMVRDITDRRRAELDARRHLHEHAHSARLAALGEMASGIAHELNQPLTAIVSFADDSLRLLESDPSNIDTVRDALQQISDQGQRAGGIIRRLREFVKKRQSAGTTLHVKEAISDALAMLEPEFRRGEIQVVTELDDDLPPINADKIQIEQVILNLAQNAVDAMVNGKCDTRRLNIKSYLPKPDTIAVTVTDSGPGFDHEISERMFEAFFTTKSKGTGLGLSISRSLLEANGGQLSARLNPSGGALFEFRLPMQTEPDA